MIERNLLRKIIDCGYFDIHKRKIGEIRAAHSGYLTDIGYFEPTGLVVIDGAIDCTPEEISYLLELERQVDREDRDL